MLTCIWNTEFIFKLPRTLHRSSILLTEKYTLKRVEWDSSKAHLQYLEPQMTQWEVLEGLFKDKSKFFKIFCVFYNKWVKGECLNLLGLFNHRFAHMNMLNIQRPPTKLILPPELLALGPRECGA